MISMTCLKKSWKSLYMSHFKSLICFVVQNCFLLIHWYNIEMLNLLSWLVLPLQHFLMLFPISGICTSSWFFFCFFPHCEWNAATPLKSPSAHLLSLKLDHSDYFWSCLANFSSLFFFFLNLSVREGHLIHFILINPVSLIQEN